METNDNNATDETNFTHNSVNHIRMSDCICEYKAAIFNQNGLAVGFTITPCTCKVVDECPTGMHGKHSQQYDDDYCVDCGTTMEMVE